MSDKRIVGLGLCVIDHVYVIESLDLTGSTTRSAARLVSTGGMTGNAVVQAAIDALVAQTQVIERAVAALDLDRIAFEGSDSLDSPDAVFQ